MMYRVLSDSVSHTPLHAPQAVLWCIFEILGGKCFGATSVGISVENLVAGSLPQRYYFVCRTSSWLCSTVVFVSWFPGFWCWDFCVVVVDFTSGTMITVEVRSSFFAFSGLSGLRNACSVGGISRDILTSQGSFTRQNPLSHISSDVPSHSVSRRRGVAWHTLKHTA